LREEEAAEFTYQKIAKGSVTRIVTDRKPIANKDGATQKPLKLAPRQKREVKRLTINERGRPIPS